MNTLNYTALETEDRVLFKRVLVDVGRDSERFEPERIYDEMMPASI